MPAAIRTAQQVIATKEGTKQTQKASMALLSYFAILDWNYGQYLLPLFFHLQLNTS